MNDDEIFEGQDEFDDEDGNGEKTSVALVSTIEPYLLKVEEVHDDRIPEGMVCMGSFIGDRLIARSAVPPEMISDVANRQLFSDPVRLALAAVEEDPGLQCRLFALLPAADVEEPDEPAEPWAASVPRFEDQVSEESPSDETTEAVVPLLLGHVVRFAKDRKHPGDLAAEAADVLQTILANDTPLSSVVDKVLEDLLGDSPDDAGPTAPDEGSPPPPQ
ncbi:MAG: hypothetical protein R3246_11425 [Acidimicrobiia bacterium]|nr:hypothetical protein [Acidimicrobiia bacterium]